MTTNGAVILDRLVFSAASIMYESLRCISFAASLLLRFFRKYKWQFILVLAGD